MGRRSARHSSVHFRTHFTRYFAEEMLIWFYIRFVTRKRRADETFPFRLGKLTYHLGKKTFEANNNAQISAEYTREDNSRFYLTVTFHSQHRTSKSCFSFNEGKNTH